MAVFKCKICGGSLDIKKGESIAVCEYCGTKQTLPRLDDEKRANLYDRANHFRRNNDYDKAMGIYETILNEDLTDAEAYWSVLLCKYGIEYVDDPTTHKYLPTINRAQYTSIFEDEDYKSAIKNATISQKGIYESEANTINEIQKGILEISSKEERFDVFICYKETDNNGRRTPDSVLATELYHELTKEGFKVFFSRITLEDKLGTAYEPYIFAALNSAKVMVALGTKPEYFNAVWVKNEWSRYLSLIKNGAKKMLIPAYRDMDPYDLPDEFSLLQAQDMSKLGFMQDLIRGIKKIIDTDKTVPVVQNNIPTVQASNVSALLDRGYMALEDSEWDNADDFFEQVLNQDAKNATAYLGKLMVELHVNKQEKFKECPTPFNNSNNFSKVIKFADLELISYLNDCIEFINNRNRLQAEEEQKEKLYYSAMDDYKSYDINRLNNAIEVFTSISGYKDSNERVDLCKQKIEKIQIEEEQKRLEQERIAEEQKIKDEKIRLERELQAEIDSISRAKKIKRNKKIIFISIPVSAVLIALIIVLNMVIIPNNKYNVAIGLIENGKILEAYEKLTALNGYKDSAKKASEIYAKYEIEKLKVANIGDTVIFGTYEQDNDTSNGEEDIEWLVLDKEDEKILVISKKALYRSQYAYGSRHIPWEKCDLRNFMNSTFLNVAFSDNEQTMIQSTTVSADKNPQYNTDVGISTTDKVFLLSIDEVEKYFSSNNSRQCKTTKYQYADKFEALIDNNGNCVWWLRTQGKDDIRIASVTYDGSVEFSGSYFAEKCFVRPAMWIIIE